MPDNQIGIDIKTFPRLAIALIKSSVTQQHPSATVSRCQVATQRVSSDEGYANAGAPLVTPPPPERERAKHMQKVDRERCSLPNTAPRVTQPHLPNLPTLPIPGRA